MAAEAASAVRPVVENLDDWSLKLSAHSHGERRGVDLSACEDLAGKAFAFIEHGEQEVRRPSGDGGCVGDGHLEDAFDSRGESEPASAEERTGAGSALVASRPPPRARPPTPASGADAQGSLVDGVGAEGRLDTSSDLADIDPERCEQGVGIAVRRLTATDDRHDLGSNWVGTASDLGEQFGDGTTFDREPRRRCSVPR